MCIESYQNSSDVPLLHANFHRASSDIGSPILELIVHLIPSHLSYLWTILHIIHSDGTPTAKQPTTRISLFATLGRIILQSAPYSVVDPCFNPLRISVAASSFLHSS